jgi:hypothetical protein
MIESPRPERSEPASPDRIEFKLEKKTRIKMSMFGKYSLLAAGFAFLVTFARTPL